MQEREYHKIHERIISERLANGLEIRILPKKDFTKAYAQLAVKYGSIDARFDTGEGIIEPPKGVAHFLEHKVFEQPDGGNALATFAQTGASPNAFTSKTMTAYHFSCTDYFDRNLEILLDFVSTPHFTDENVKKEQGIIGQEIGMVNDKPHFKVYENLMCALYKVHPARDSIIGTLDSISKIDRHVLLDCYKTFYIPSNMILTVVGDVDAKRVISAAEGMFVKKYTAPPARDYGTEPRESRMREISANMECSMPIFAVGFKKQMKTSGDGAAKARLCASLACELLFGESSPLYAQLYREGLINQEFGAEAIFYPESVALVLSGESRRLDEVVHRALNVTTDISDDYFMRIKRAVHGMRLRRFDHFGALCRSMSEAYFADYDYFDTFEVFDEIKKEDVTAFIAGVLNEESMTVSKIIPTGKEEENE